MNKHKELNVSSDDLVNQERLRPASIGKFIEQQKRISDIFQQSPSLKKIIEQQKSISDAFDVFSQLSTIKEAIATIELSKFDQNKIANNILKFAQEYDDSLSAARQFIKQQDSIVQSFRDIFFEEQKRITELASQQISISEFLRKLILSFETEYGDRLSIQKLISSKSPIPMILGAAINGFESNISAETDQNKIEEALKEVEEATAKNAEIAESVISGDDNATHKFAAKQIYNLIIMLLPFLGYTVKDFIEMLQPSSKEIICREYEIENSENAEVRKVRLAKGTLNVRQYPNEKGKVLAELPNGEYICLPNKQKGNQRWLKVQTKDENDNLIIGYVNARFTEKVTFINGEKL